MQEIGFLLYYSFSFFLVSSLHTSFHKKIYRDKCKACISHSYIWPLVIFIYSILISFITILYVKNYFFIFIMLVFVGTIPVFPLYSIIERPIIISSQTVWLFCMMIGLVTSFRMILNSVEITQTLLSKISYISVITTALTALLVIMATKILNTKKENEIIERVFNQGSYYVTISTLTIAFGVLFFIIMPLLLR